MKTKPNLAEPKLAKSKSQEAKAIKKDSGKQDASIKAKNVRKNKVSASQRQQLNDPLLLKSSSKTESKRKEETKKKNKEEEKEVCTKATALSSSLYGKPKPFTKHTTKVAKITEWIEITIDELHKVLLEDRKHNKDIDEEEICPICRCELYDDILKMKKDEINKIQTDQLSGKIDIEVVRFKSCNHFYHKSCTEGMLGGKEYIRCAVCSKVYGEIIGDSPPGEMKWRYYPKGKLPLETYEK